jgi:polysaccharide export outer membrane protein
MTKNISFFTLFFLMLNCLIVDSVSAADENIQSKEQASFLLGFEDEIEISVWQDDTLTKTVKIRPDGKISFPLIGDILAVGYTVEAFREAIEKRIRDYIPKASVTVVVTSISSPKVFIVGEITTPGAYIMGRRLRVMQLLALAGGLQEFADRRNIMILREDNRQQKILKFDYSKVVKGVEVEQNILLKPGDTIVIP